MTKDVIRRCRFQPYRRGKGPTFSLVMWDTGRYDGRGRTVIGYRLSECYSRRGGFVIFEGEDFHASPLYADDSDETVHSLMTFLTLRPGDTDADYFAGYTERQRRFCDEHAESLAMCVMDRFGEG